MASDTLQHWSIEHGPSKWDLMLSLFDHEIQLERSSHPEGRARSFWIGDEECSRGRIVIVITGVKILRNYPKSVPDPETWIIEGYIPEGAGPELTIYYSTKKRRGHVSFDRKYLNDMEQEMEQNQARDKARR